VHIDHQPYARFAGPARLEKSVNSLLGIVEGIAIDNQINETELSYLHLWLSEHGELRGLHPYNELVPIVEQAVSDGVLTEEEHDDIVWLCKQLRSEKFYDRVSADLQRLHAILGGIVADLKVSEAELRGLSDWMEDHDHLRSCWPFDEIGSLLTAILKDGKIDDREHAMLLSFFSEFVALCDGRTITSALMTHGVAIGGLCAVDPEITFAERAFCFTGASSRYSRKEIAGIVTELGGRMLDNVSNKLNYLVIGAEGNPCWAYACYGRKVEKAVELRKAGARVLIVHEVDFHDAVAGYA